MNKSFISESKHISVLSLRSPGVLLATWFGCGYLPKAPGSWGSLASLPFAWIIVTHAGSWVLVLASVVFFFIGIWASNVYIKKSGTLDPGPVVIDEVVGQWLTLAFVPTELKFYVIGFILFRLIDIFKPWPVCWVDRTIVGGFGVMLDDVLAALYSGGAVYLLCKMKFI
jgi:phosphatidylglycerophosphatase A